MDTTLAQPNLNVLPLIYETLLEYDDKGNLTPWLAESWDMSSDGLTWTFNLRKGVKWTNGDEMTSDDVKLSIERYTSDASQSAWSPMHRQTVADVEAADKYTIKVHSKSPPYLFYPAQSRTRIHHKSYFDQVGLDAFSKQPIAAVEIDQIHPERQRGACREQGLLGHAETRLGQSRPAQYTRGIDQNCTAQARRS